MTWRWRLEFDDYVKLAINDATVLEIGNVGARYANATLTNGPNKIEIRFGDGSGNAGPNALAGVSYNSTDLTSDNISLFRILEDSGLGELLTTDIAIGLAFGQPPPNPRPNAPSSASTPAPSASPRPSPASGKACSRTTPSTP